MQPFGLGVCVIVARIVVIVGHSKSPSLCESLGEAYRRGAEVGGHAASLHATARMRFDPILRAGLDEPQLREPDLEAAHADMVAADHIVVIFPLWFGAMPAILKGFWDRIFQPEAVEPMRRGEMIKPLRGKTARIIVTMSMPGTIFRWWYRAHVLAILRRHVIGFLGARRIRTTVFGLVGQSDPAKRQRWLAEIEELGRRGD